MASQIVRACTATARTLLLGSSTERSSTFSSDLRCGYVLLYGKSAAAMMPCSAVVRTAIVMLLCPGTASRNRAVSTAPAWSAAAFRPTSSQSMSHVHVNTDDRSSASENVSDESKLRHSGRSGTSAVHMSSNGARGALRTTCASAARQGGQHGRNPIQGKDKDAPSRPPALASPVYSRVSVSIMMMMDVK